MKLKLLRRMANKTAGNYFVPLLPLQSKKARDSDENEARFKFKCKAIRWS